MRTTYFTNKHYLTKDNRRIAHVHIVGDAYKVCMHNAMMNEPKKYKLDKAAFEQFCSDRGLSIEE